MCMKSNLNCAITCIATLLQDLMSSVPTGTENTVTENPQMWVPVPNIPGTVPVFEGKNR